MISHTIPKISCIVLSVDSPSQSFVDDFLSQNYPNKELVVLSENPPQVEIDDDNILFVQRPRNLSEEEQKDLLIELTTGEMICWWENQEDEFWLTQKFRQWSGDHEDDKLFFSKMRFYKAANMLYSGKETEVDHDYFSKR